MTTHVQAKALRNVCFKISKLGSNTDQYRILRQAMLGTTAAHTRFTPAFIIGCETPEAVRAHLSELFPNDEEGGVYKKRRRFLEREFAEFIYWSEREALSSAEVDSLLHVDCSNRASMDHLLCTMHDCAETDPRHSIVLGRHAVLDGVFYLLDSNGVYPDMTADIKQAVEQIIHMAEHPSAEQDILFSPDRSFMTSVMPVVEYVDMRIRYYGWEESNRKPDYPNVRAAMDFCHAATFLCRVVWRWIAEDNDWPSSNIHDLEEDLVEDGPSRRALRPR